MTNEAAEFKNPEIQGRGGRPEATAEAVRAYWNVHIHDLEIATNPVGTKGFFEELDAYRYEKLDYLPRIVDFPTYRGKNLLEIGCGAGIDLVRFAKNGARVTGVDLSDVAIDLARKNFELNGLQGDFRVMDGEALTFDEGSFDVVFAHGVLQYTHDIRRMIGEIHRVLRPGGEAIMMVYNRLSWFNLMAVLFGVKLEHQDAPVLNKYSIREFRELLTPFSKVRIMPERFPVKTRLHHGIKAKVYNGIFVGGFNLIPRPLVRPFGWHINAKAFK